MGMLRIDRDRIFEELERERPKRVILSAPDGILPYLDGLVSEIEDKGIEVITIGDAVYGACDTTNLEADALGADLSIHVGHEIATERVGKTLFVRASYDVGFEEVVSKFAEGFGGLKRVGLVTICQDLWALEEVKEMLERLGYEVMIGRGRGWLKDGQVLGCQFYTAYEIKDEVEAFLFLGQGTFHPIGVALATGKPVLILDPHFKEVRDVEASAREALKKAILGVYRALDAESFGVVIGLKEGQMRVKEALKLSNELKRFGKRARLLAMREVREDRLSLFGLDAFIQTACPRISMDEVFSKPVLSVPQAYALFRLWRGEELGDMLKKPDWL
ncbi:MAG: diphthamide biosynthesis enzyme Dph2 [Thaumarchaeota archaeon]|nr:diphthamide biosynthesis enzyme Dph2 [Nitrososphaerota archaeon]